MNEGYAEGGALRIARLEDRLADVERRHEELREYVEALTGKLNEALDELLRHTTPVAEVECPQA